MNQLATEPSPLVGFNHRIGDLLIADCALRTISNCFETGVMSRGGAGGLVVLAGFKPVAGCREAAWVGSIPTRLRQRGSAEF